MKPVALTSNIYWVGGIDWDIRNFHGYLTQRGSTYNSYCIIDEKIALVDTVKTHLFEEMLSRLSTIIDPGKIDYVIANHVEMDHSGSLPHIMKICPHATIITSPKGEQGLRKHYREDWNYQVVNSGDSLSLGKRSLQFVLTPMVHWPDNMVSYCPEEKILFSNDAFGQHIASSERFDDDYPRDIIFEEAKKYYANIVLPYSSQVQKALDAAGSLDIGLIAPSHGIMWRRDIPGIFERYREWSSNQTRQRALIIYDTMWHSTEKLAHAIQRGFDNRGIDTEILNLKHNHISDIMTSMLTASHICIGSPTLNMSILPTVAGFLAYFRGLAPKNRKGLAFGSYGWAPKCIEMIEEVFTNCKFEILESVSVNYIPDDEFLENVTKKIESMI